LADRGYYRGVADNVSAEDYNRWLNDVGIRQTEHTNSENMKYQTHRDAIEDEQWWKQYDESVRQYDEQMAFNKQQYEDSKKVISSGGGGNAINNGGDKDGTFHKAVFSRTDSDGNNVFYINGKEYTYAPGVNPYTGTTNSDTKNGTFSNGYQPNNVNGQKLSKSGITDVVNGVTQNVWKTPDGKLWIWDGTQNKYLSYEE
jgi:hypothetical protein